MCTHLFRGIKELREIPKIVRDDARTIKQCLNGTCRPPQTDRRARIHGEVLRVQWRCSFASSRGSIEFRLVQWRRGRRGGPPSTSASRDDRRGSQVTPQVYVFQVVYWSLTKVKMCKWHFGSTPSFTMAGCTAGILQSAQASGRRLK